MFFQLLSTIKVKLVDEMMQVLIYVFFTCSAHKNFHLSRFSPDF